MLVNQNGLLLCLRFCSLNCYHWNFFTLKDCWQSTESRKWKLFLHLLKLLYVSLLFFCCCQVSTSSFVMDFVWFYKRDKYTVVTLYKSYNFSSWIYPENLNLFTWKFRRLVHRRDLISTTKDKTKPSFLLNPKWQLGTTIKCTRIVLVWGFCSE